MTARGSALWIALLLAFPFPDPARAGERGAEAPPAMEEAFHGLLRELRSAIDEEEAHLVECTLWEKDTREKTPDAILKSLRKAGAKVDAVESRLRRDLLAGALSARRFFAEGMASDGSCWYSPDEAIERILLLSERIDRLRIRKRSIHRETRKWRSRIDRLKDALEIGGGLRFGNEGMSPSPAGLRKGLEREIGIAVEKSAELRRASEIHTLLLRRMRRLLQSPAVRRKLIEEECVEINGGWMREEKAEQ